MKRMGGYGVKTQCPSGVCMDIVYLHMQLVALRHYCKCHEQNKRRVLSNESISMLTLQYIACKHASLSQVKLEGQKGYGTRAFKKRNSWTGQHYRSV